ncbi:MAG: hypothetical protein CM1200mP4_0130 [Rhodospirillaceae bacterium]|nr:MAG: hypothetical protein CM1200mP4_0130 [Rhodospirillaceae bacterium]
MNKRWRNFTRTRDQANCFRTTRMWCDKTKSTYLLDLAHHFTEGNLAEQNWKELNDSEVKNLITRVKGIGPWTAEMFLMFHLLRPDILPVGDVGIQNAMAHFKKKTNDTQK